jgi:hypothetical protein
MDGPTGRGLAVGARAGGRNNPRHLFRGHALALGPTGLVARLRAGSRDRLGTGPRLTTRHRPNHHKRSGTGRDSFLRQLRTPLPTSVPGVPQRLEADHPPGPQETPTQREGGLTRLGGWCWAFCRGRRGLAARRGGSSTPSGMRRRMGAPRLLTTPQGDQCRPLD